MRIAFLFDPALTGQDSLHFVFGQWLNGLVESQNEIKVLSRKGGKSVLGAVHEKVDWAEPSSNWTWLELPKILSALLPFAPDVIHLVLCRQPRAWQLWPALAALPGRTRTMVSLGDGLKWPKGWQNRVRMISPVQSQALGVPAMASVLREPTTKEKSVYIPGPLQHHADWRKTMDRLMEIIPTRTDWTFHCGWNWSDLPLPERLSIRSEWLKAVPLTRVIMSRPETSIAETLQSCQLVVLGVLNAGWTRTVLEQTAGVMQIAKLDHGQDWPRMLSQYDFANQHIGKLEAKDSAINQLIRAYYQLLV